MGTPERERSRPAPCLVPGRRGQRSAPQAREDARRRTRVEAVPIISRTTRTTRRTGRGRGRLFGARARIRPPPGGAPRYSSFGHEPGTNARRPRVMTRARRDFGSVAVLLAGAVGPAFAHPQLE